ILMNVCLLINSFSTNNSIIITKRTIRNFLSQLSLVFGNFIAKTPQNKNFHSKLFGKAPAKSGILGRKYLKTFSSRSPKRYTAVTKAAHFVDNCNKKTCSDVVQCTVK